MSIQRSMQQPVPSAASLGWTVWLAGAVALVLAVLLCGDLGSALGSLFADNPGFAPYFTT